MAENFRNKQWFKKISQEEKDYICNELLIDEKTLKHAGRETEDGRVVINLLRIDHINYTPKIWDNCLKLLKKNVDILNTTDSSLEYYKSLYKIFNPDVKYLSYKDNAHNNVFLQQTSKYVTSWINKFLNNDEYEKNYCAYQIYAQLYRLFESDLQIIKK